jgi:hypothetical protein
MRNHNSDAALTAPHMAVKLQPGMKSCNIGAIWLLQRYQELVSQRVLMEPSRDVKPLPEALAIGNSTDCLFKAGKDICLWFRVASPEFLFHGIGVSREQE